jgi:hypothetical protein
MPSIPELSVELCGMENSLMPMPASWISATYLFKNKFKALNTLLNIAECTITRERIFFFMPKNLAWTQQ